MRFDPITKEGFGSVPQELTNRRFVQASHRSEELEVACERKVGLEERLASFGPIKKAALGSRRRRRDERGSQPKGSSGD